MTAPAPVPASTLVGQRVLVYRNLHKKCWSILVKGRVVARPRSLTLASVTFVVRPGGVARARREGRRNVHAFVRGVLVECECPAVSAALGGGAAEVLVRYRIGAGFTDEGGQARHQARLVRLLATGQCLAS